MSTIDHSIIIRAAVEATGASVHKLRALSATYVAACEADTRAPSPRAARRVERTHRALELGLAGLSETAAHTRAREEYPDVDAA